MNEGKSCNCGVRPNVLLFACSGAIATAEEIGRAFEMLKLNLQQRRGKCETC